MIAYEDPRVSERRIIAAHARAASGGDLERAGLSSRPLRWTSSRTLSMNGPGGAFDAPD